MRLSPVCVLASCQSDKFFFFFAGATTKDFAMKRRSGIRNDWNVKKKWEEKKKGQRKLDAGWS